MSDRELEAIRQRKLRDLQKKTTPKEQKEMQTDAHAILDKVLRGRAWEVFNAAKAQFPAQMAKIEQLLVNLASQGKINEMEGEQLYALLREIGLPVRMNTTIRVLNHGKTKSLSEKFRESTK